MNETAGIALLYLMFGQFLILSFGILVLWWMSEPGTAWTQSRAERRAGDRVARGGVLLQPGIGIVSAQRDVGESDGGGGVLGVGGVAVFFFQAEDGIRDTNS